MKAYEGCGGISQLLLHLGTRLSWYETLKPKNFIPTYSLRHPLTRSLVGFNSQFVRFGDEINILLPFGIETRFINHAVFSLITMPTSTCEHSVVTMRFFIIFA